MKRRTGLLFSSAAVVGLLAGAGAGYEIQDHRKPTPLPPLDAAAPAAVALAAAAPAVTPDPATDDGAKLNGDLRTLLLDKPAGAKDPSFGPGLSWITAYDLAEFHGDLADHDFIELGSSGFRRAAQRAWLSASGQTVEIDVIQFRSTAGAKAFNADAGVTDGEADIAGTGGHADSSQGVNQEGDHWALASFVHGDIVVFALIFDHTKAVAASDAASLAGQQAAKL